MKIQWMTDVETALTKAAEEGKHVLVYAHDAESIACRQMDSTTHSDERVVRFMETRLIPLRRVVSDGTGTDDFRIKWSPSLVLLDHEGTEHDRMMGYLPPEEWIPWVLLGMAKSFLNRDLLNEALSKLNDILLDHPDSAIMPEVIYLRGVVRYKLVVVPTPLKEAYEKLQADFPSSIWTIRAHPYSRL